MLSQFILNALDGSVCIIAFRTFPIGSLQISIKSSESILICNEYVSYYVYWTGTLDWDAELGRGTGTLDWDATATPGQRHRDSDTGTATPGRRHHDSDTSDSDFIFVDFL